MKRYHKVNISHTSCALKEAFSYNQSKLYLTVLNIHKENYHFPEPSSPI